MNIIPTIVNNQNPLEKSNYTTKEVNNNNNKQNKNNIEKLPKELLNLIFSQLNYSEWINVSSTSSTFNQQAQSPSVTFALFQKEQEQFDPNKRIEIAQKFGTLAKEVTTFDLTGIDVTEESINKIAEVYPNIQQFNIPSDQLSDKTIDSINLHFEKAILNLE